MADVRSNLLRGTVGYRQDMRGDGRMLSTGFSKEELEKAAADVGVKLVAFRSNGRNRAKQPKFRFRLGLVGEKYRSFGDGGRKIAAVCWHGHRDFMRRLFEINPDGVLETMYATYHGSEEFAKNYMATGSVARRTGDYQQTIAYRYVCECNRGGR